MSGIAFVNPTPTGPYGNGLGNVAWFSPAAIRAGLPAPYNTWIVQQIPDGSVDRDSMPNYPSQRFVPVFSGGWPSYSNGPQQLGQAAGQF